MASKAGSISSPTGKSCVEMLTRCFPNATPVRVPVQVAALRAGGQSLREATVIEFGTPNEALFASTLPLELNDRVRLHNANSSLDAEAEVVAVHYFSGQRAVAARFLSPVRNWITKQ